MTASRLLRIAMGLWFVTVGTVFTLVGVAAAVRHGRLLPLGVAVLSAVAVVIGAISLVRLAYLVNWGDADHLILAFPFRTERIARSDILWYRKFGATWALSEAGEAARAGIFCVLRYAVPLRRRSSWAVFWLMGVGPAFSTQGNEFRTLLDERMPEKRR